MHTQMTSQDVVSAIERIERAVRSRLSNPVAEIDTTVTRDTELVFDPKSESEEEDEYDEEDPNEDEGDDDEEEEDKREANQRGQSVDSGRESASQPADSESPQRQYTPTHVPDSKRPEMPESRIPALFQK